MPNRRSAVKLRRVRCEKFSDVTCAAYLVAELPTVARRAERTCRRLTEAIRTLRGEAACRAGSIHCRQTTALSAESRCDWRTRRLNLPADPRQAWLSRAAPVDRSLGACR